MRVLVACEESGVVRDAFRRLGHEAVACDTSTDPDNRADYRTDVLELLGSGFDLMVAHPPCTYLTVAGNRWYADRPDLIEEAAAFFMALWNAPIEKVCIENPVGRMSTIFRPPDQYIQPYQFGHSASKKTGLWLRGLPKLVPTQLVFPSANGYYDNQTPSGQNKLGPSPERAKLRARTYPGIAAAMAEQWGA